MDFKLHAPYSATGDQPEAIRKLTEGVRLGLDEQVLLGVTGSGKTFTMANGHREREPPDAGAGAQQDAGGSAVLRNSGSFSRKTPWNISFPTTITTSPRPISPTRTPISKRTPPSTTRSSACATARRRRCSSGGTSSSSRPFRCIYGLGDPIDYKNMVISLRTGMEKSREELMQKLVEIRYERNDLNFTRNTFRVRGDTVEIYPVYWSGRAIRVEFFGDEIDRISEINAVSGMPERVMQPCGHLPRLALRRLAGQAQPRHSRDRTGDGGARVAWFEEHDKLLEAQRIRQRTMYDIEMLQEIGFCSGIENYSRVISRPCARRRRR